MTKRRDLFKQSAYIKDNMNKKKKNERASKRNK